MSLHPFGSRLLCLGLRAVMPSSLLLLLLWSLSLGQVPTDIRPDGTLGTQVSQDGRVHEITGGTRPGDGPNLFHSFDRFNVGTNDIARFTGNAGIDNIISRVTGGAESIIDGQLESSATLYLLNPSGVMFGPNATLNINGSFHVSTADALRFADDAVFSARLSEKSQLTVASPAAFGFLRENPAGITIKDSHLEVPGGATLSVIGGDIAMVGGSLTAPGGRVNLASVAATGAVPLRNVGQVPALDMASFTRLGDMTMADDARINVSGEGGGTVVIRSGQLMVNRTTVAADTIGGQDGAALGIDISVRGDVSLKNDTRMTTDSVGTGHAGDIRIRAGRLRMENARVASRSRSRPFGGSGGDAGAITASATTITLTDDARIDGTTSGAGRGGDITVTASDTIRFVGIDPQSSSTGVVALLTGTGAAGTIVIRAPRIALSNGAQISSATAGPRQGGAITVSATDTLVMDAASISASTLGTGGGGNVQVRAGALTLLRGSQINSFTRGLGHAGTVTVNATGTVTLEGSIGRFSSGIFAASLGSSGNAGDVRISAPDLILRDGALIGVEAIVNEGELGRPGNIVVEVERLTLEGGAQIDNSVRGPGPGGSVRVTATDTILITGASETGDPSGFFGQADDRGNAGSVTISAPTLIMHGGGIELSTISSGRGGDIFVESDTLTLAEGAIISAASMGAGDAGNIHLAAMDISLRDNSSITTRVEQSEGSGGNITMGGSLGAEGAITGRIERLTLEGSQITADTAAGSGANITLGVDRMVVDGGSAITANTGAGAGGNIRIAGAVRADGEVTARAGTVVLRGSRITANADEGTGGRIDIVTEVFLADPVSEVDASSQAGGIDGEVKIEAVVTNLSEVVQPLSQRFAPETPLLRDRCATRLHQGLVSSFVERERAGTSTSPDGLLPSRLDMSVGDTILSGKPWRRGIAMASDPSWHVHSRCP